MNYKVIAILDTFEDRVIPQSLELVAFAKAAVGLLSRSLFVITGKNVKDECEIISAEYGINIAAVESDSFYYPNPHLLMKVVSGLMKEFSPETVCLSHTVRNCAVAAGLSASQKVSCITGVESLSSDSGSVVYRRTLFNGKLKEIVKPSTLQKIITVIPGAYIDPDESRNRADNASVIYRKIESDGSQYQPLSVRREPDIGAKLEDADVIISAGRGIGNPDNLEIVRETAKLFDNSAIGASRPVCDNKWLPYRHQVGITGKTVSPKLYMALGISGSQQHIAGMKNSQCIVAVNHDPHAAIFSVADYIIVEDIEKFLPAFISKYHEKYGDIH